MPDDPTPRAEEILRVLLGLDVLADLPRTGWLLRGVRPCESVADHSYGVALATALLVDALRGEGVAVDGERALRMALVHDAPEAATGDVPHPAKADGLADALRAAEGSIAARLLSPPLAEAFAEASAKASLEARIVKAADTIQMMVKAYRYGQSGRGRDLEGFWASPRNVDHRGLAVVREVLEALWARAGRPLPVSGEPAASAPDREGQAAPSGEPRPADHGS